MSINTITIEGNLTADPELRFTPGGKAVLNFSIAHNTRRYNKDTNQWEDGEPTFIRGSYWGQPAENASQSLTKGTAVIITGRIQQRNWTNKEGENRSALELQAESISPSLKWATATIQRTQNSTGQQNTRTNAGAVSQSTDPWNNAPQGVASNDENPPF